jgi:hypothetical protein
MGHDIIYFEFNGFKIELAGLDFGKIQDVVDDTKQGI